MSENKRSLLPKKDSKEYLGYNFDIDQAFELLSENDFLEQHRDREYNRSGSLNSIGSDFNFGAEWAPKSGDVNTTNQSHSDNSEAKKLKRNFSDINAQKFDSFEEANFSDNDDSDNDDDVQNNHGSKNDDKKKKPSSSRPNVREHSKAQREKRKENISSLEQQARQLADDLNDMNCKFITSLEDCRSHRHRQHRFVLEFLKLWINDSSSEFGQVKDGGGPDGPNGKFLTFESRMAMWMALFKSVEEQNTNDTKVLRGNGIPIQNHSLVMNLPSTYSRFSPNYVGNYCASSSSSFSQLGRSNSDISNAVNLSFQNGSSKSRRVLPSLSHVVADSAGLSVMCQIISEFGPVQICNFMLGIDIPLETFISEDNLVSAPFFIYSKNATMCGGKFEIDVKGYLLCEFSGLAIQRIDLIYDDWYLTEQLLESFGRAIYKPFSEISMNDNEFLWASAEFAQDSESKTGRKISIDRILHMTKGRDSASYVLPHVLNEHASLGDKVVDECRVITSFDANVIVEAVSPAALSQFGQISGRSLISADWITEALSTLSQWSPYVCSLNTVSSPSSDIPAVETKCLLFPLFDKTQFGARPSIIDDGRSERAKSVSCMPNKICWVIFNRQGSSNEKQLGTIIQQFLQGCVTKFAAQLNFIGSSCYFLSFMSLLSQAELILQDDSDNDDDEDSPTSGKSSTSDLREFMSMLESFLKWLAAVESKIWSDENPLLEVFAFKDPDSSCPPSPNRLSRMSLMELEKSSNERKSHDPELRSKGLAPNSTALSTSFSDIISSNSSVSSRLSSRSSSFSSDAEEALHDDGEWTLFMEILEDINNFFSMLRKSNVTKYIVYLLKSIDNTKDYLLLEEFNAHCLTKHTNGRVCFLMKQAKDLIQRQDFDRAVETLNEIISIDSNFIEAYNRRARALFGLHRAQECFYDLEYVLKSNPLHYGALCGKGLLSMNLKAFAPASECFEKALVVNPMLANDEVIMKSVTFCRQILAGEPVTGPQ